MRTDRRIAAYAAMLAFSVALSVGAAPAGHEASLTQAQPVAALAVVDRGGPTSRTRVEPAVVRVQAAADAARSHAPVPDVLRPDLAHLHGDFADVGACRYTTGQHRLCRRGAVRSHKVLVVLGDSHARAWIPALQTIATRTRHAGYYLAKPGCTAARVTPDHGNGGFVGCVAWREWAIAAIRRLRPDILLITGAMPPGVVASDGVTVTDPPAVADLMRAGLASTVAAVRGRARHVFIVADTPGLTKDPAVCLAAPGADLGDCASAPSAAARLYFAAERAAARASGSRLVDTRSWFCSKGLCPAVVGSTVTYRDGGHMTTVYSRSLSWALQHAMGVVRLR